MAVAAKDATILDFLVSRDCPWERSRVKSIFWTSWGSEWAECRETCEMVLKYKYEEFKLPCSDQESYSDIAIRLLQLATDACDWEFLEKVRAYNYTFEGLKPPVNMAALWDISSRPALSTFDLDPASAVDHSNQPVLEFACELQPAKVTLGLTARAAAIGNLDMLEWLHNHPKIGELHPKTADMAAAMGHSDCKQNALEHGCTLTDSDDDAAQLENDFGMLSATDPTRVAAPSSSTTTDPETTDE